MTTPALGSGRPSDIHRPASRTLRLFCAGALIAASLPALASGQMPTDPLDSPALLTQSHDDTALPSTVQGSAYFSSAESLFRAYAVAGTPSAAQQVKEEGRMRRMLNRALALLGTPYRWGGSTPESGFDCSGLVGYVFRTTLGVELPRISRDMANVGELIRDPKALVEGDLVFFSRRGKNVDHVGIYIGNGQFVHSPRTGKNVEISTLATGYWSQKFLKARRVANG